LSPLSVVLFIIQSSIIIFDHPTGSRVPRGSVLGPLLFTVYVSLITSLLFHRGANQHQYADDTQLFISISQSSATADLHTLGSALADLSQWFSLNCLALNPTKSDAILLGTHQRNSTLSNISHINVVGSIVPLSDSVKVFGITLDKSLTFNKHSNQVSQSCYYVEFDRLWTSIQRAPWQLHLSTLNWTTATRFTITYHKSADFRLFRTHLLEPLLTLQNLSTSLQF